MTTEIEDVILGLMFIVMGIVFICFHGRIARMNDRQNRRFFRIAIAIRSYEIGFIVSGIGAVLFG